MTRNAKTYGIPASAPGGEGFPFMPFLGVDFLAKNSSNNLHISELSLSLSHILRGRRSRALIYNFPAEIQKGERILFPCPESRQEVLSEPFSFSPFRLLAAGGCTLRRHTAHGLSMSVCRRAFSCNPNMNVSIEREQRKLVSYAEREKSRMKFNVTI